LNWFPFYPSDFIGATVGLSCQEVSLYNWMLTLYYELGPFPSDPVRCYRIVRCESDEQKRTVDFLLANFFVRQEDGWYQERAEQEKVRAAQRHDQACERGKHSAAARLTKYGTSQPISRKAFETLSKRSGNASELTTTTTTTTPTTITTTTKEKSRGSRFALTQLPDDWKTFCKTTRADLDPASVFASFGDYWRAVPGAKGCKLDWAATWRNWVRNQKVPVGVNPASVKVREWFETASGVEAKGRELNILPAQFCMEDGRQDWQSFSAAVKRAALERQAA
jgi:uncharacterized protein YdaU (DUF1376 family)